MPILVRPEPMSIGRQRSIWLHVFDDSFVFRPIVSAPFRIASWSRTSSSNETD